MNPRFRRVAVLGAGIMGRGLAAHLAGAGLSVLLLDRVPAAGGASGAVDGADRNRLAAAAIEHLLAERPPLLLHPRDCDRIQLGNLTDHLPEAGACDLVIEAVVEDLAVKREVLQALLPHLGPATVVASTTAGLTTAQLLGPPGDPLRAGLSRRFVITQFFHPVRYMRLVELIGVEDPDADPQVADAVAELLSQGLGKGVVRAHDTPAFIANRLGVIGLLWHIQLAVTGGYTIEEVDAVCGPPMGRPRTGVLRAADMVGLDTILSLAQLCQRGLPQDEARALYKPPAVLEELVRRGLCGDKSGAGFYRSVSSAGRARADGLARGAGPSVEVLDWKTLDYRPYARPALPELARLPAGAPLAVRLPALLAGEGRAAALAWRALAQTLVYASHRVGPRDAGAQDPAVCDDLRAIDQALRWGYGWEAGPFELWDLLGVESVLERLERDGLRPARWVRGMLAAGQRTFYSESDRSDGRQVVYSFGAEEPARVPVEQARVTRLRPMALVAENASAAIYDLEDGVAGLVLRGRSGALDGDVVAMGYQAVDLCLRHFDALVVGGEPGEVFSSGISLGAVLHAAERRDFAAVDKLLIDLQQLNLLMRYGPVPVVAAPCGLTLGAGAELVLHAAAVRAHVELYMGLATLHVGLVPAAGGCKELLARALSRLPDEVDPTPVVQRVFESISLLRVSGSAPEARELGLLEERDGVTFNRDHLLYDAKQAALGLHRAGYRPPRPRTFRVPGRPGLDRLRAALQALHQGGQFSAYDVYVGGELARVLVGGDLAGPARVSEQHILDLEREAFLRLCGEKRTQERMAYMLQHGQPLRN